MNPLNPMGGRTLKMFQSKGVIESKGYCEAIIGHRVIGRV